MDLDRLRSAIREGRLEWRKHALVRIAERRIRQSDILAVVEQGEPIEEYRGDRPFPSVLLLGMVRQATPRRGSL